MKPLSRRAVTASLAAAVTAVPVVAAFPGAHDARGTDPLPREIQRYRDQVDEVNRTRGLSDDEIDARIDKTDAILAEAVNLPIVSKAGALAIISLFVEDGFTLSQHWLYGDELVALAKSALDYLAA